MNVSCENCGACCEHMGTPPGYVMFVPPDGVEMYEGYKRSPDYKRWLSIPDAVKAELQAYYKAVRSGEIPDRTAGDDTPCLWLTEDKKCKHYEYRPSICRGYAEGGVIEPGDIYCLNHRERLRIPLQVI